MEHYLAQTQGKTNLKEMKKASNIASLSLLMVLLTSMVWVNSELEEVYLEIALNDELRNYLPIKTADFRELKMCCSNGYPIEIKKCTEERRMLRSRVSQFQHQVSGDTLIIEFTGARVSPSALTDTHTPAGLIIFSEKLEVLILTNTHNRISGLEQEILTLKLEGESYTELSDNRLRKLHIEASDASSFEFRNENSADAVSISLAQRSVGFLDGLRYHELKPVMEESALVVLSKNALNELVKK